MPLPQRKTHALSYGRVSIPGANYFITLTTQKRKTDLTTNNHPATFLEALRTLHRERVLTLLCATTMPDHIHLLITLREHCDLSQTISKFKNHTRKFIATKGLYWQRNYYDHRLRHAPNTNEFARYIFLNPYRKNLLQPTQHWPYWVCSRDYHPDFLSQLEHTGTPPVARYKTPKHQQNS